MNIGNNVFIGANVTILKGVNVGEGSVVANGSVVTKMLSHLVLLQACPPKKYAPCKCCGFKIEAIGDVLE